MVIRIGYRKNRGDRCVVTKEVKDLGASREVDVGRESVGKGGNSGGYLKKFRGHATGGKVVNRLGAMRCEK